MSNAFPTTYLRFVERDIPPGAEPTTRVRVLQQRWILMNEHDEISEWEWRDVPVDIEAAQPIVVERGGEPAESGMLAGNGGEAA
jgi:hypothetical protein